MKYWTERIMNNGRIEKCYWPELRMLQGKQMEMEARMRAILDMGKVILSKERAVIQTGIPVKEGKLLTAYHLRHTDRMEQRVAEAQFKRMIRRTGADTAIFVQEVWVGGEECTCWPSEHPQRREAIAVIGMNQRGYCKSLAQVFTRDSNNIIIFLGEPEIAEASAYYLADVWEL
ncbi:MAG: hypothetical protein ABSB95_13130 [Dissulfurispiraceae bacterium]